MKLTSKDVEELRKILVVSKTIGVEGIVLTEGMARGATIAIDAAIITKSNLSLPEDLKIGIGRVSELEKRLDIFSGEVTGECKANDSGTVTQITFTSGKSKVQFRCQSPDLMKYPQSNSDEPVGEITFSKAEAQQVSKAAKRMSSENIVLAVSRSGVVKLECVDSANDKFEIELSAQVKYAEDAESIVQTYLASLFVELIDSISREAEEFTVTIGQQGSLTATLKGHTIMVLSMIYDGED